MDYRESGVVEAATRNFVAVLLLLFAVAIAVVFFTACFYGIDRYIWGIA